MRFDLRHRYTREQACQVTGATLQELVQLEVDRVLVPRTCWWPLWRPGPSRLYYTPEQVEVLRWLIAGRRRRQVAFA